MFLTLKSDEPDLASKFEFLKYLSFKVDINGKNTCSSDIGVRTQPGFKEGGYAPDYSLKCVDLSIEFLDKSLQD